MSKGHLVISSTFLLISLLIPELQLQKINIKLEQYSFCPDLQNTIAKQNKGDVIIKVARNILSITGSINFTQPVKKPVELQVKMSKCDTPTTCVNYLNNRIPQVCDFFKKFPSTNYGIGDFFIPKIRCPIKQGLYAINMTQYLRNVVAMPLQSNLYKARTIFYELESDSKKRVIICVDYLITVEFV